MSKKRYFQKLYNFDATSNKYLIEVSLDNFEEVYDDWDPSPFKKRDIEDEFNEFILDASEDIPLKHDIAIILYLPQAQKNENKENALKAAFANYYGYAVERVKKDLRKFYKKILFHLIFSIILLTSRFFLLNTSSNIIFKVLQEGIFIGGWVFLWEVFTDIFINRDKIYEEYKLYKRVYYAELRFIYK